MVYLYKNGLYTMYKCRNCGIFIRPSCGARSERHHRRPADPAEKAENWGFSLLSLYKT
jgi:hypothetical protein